MITDVKMPRIGTNDDYVKVGQWLVTHGEKIACDDFLAILETTKETTDLISETSGYLFIDSNEGEEYEVGRIIAHICETRDELNVLEQNKTSSNFESAKITKKAADLAKKHNIDISLINIDGIIREKDVQMYISKDSKHNSTSTILISCNDVIIMGGGGMCKMVIDSIRRAGGLNIRGILDERGKGFDVMGIDIIGEFDIIELLMKEGFSSLVNTVGSISANNQEAVFSARKDVYLKAKGLGYNFPNIIHPTAIVEGSAKLGEGNIILAGALVGSDAVVGNNTIINTGSIVSHDCYIGDHTRISPGAILAGRVTIGENSLVGMGVTIYMDVKIGRNVIIGNGKNIFSNIPDNSVVL